MTKKVNWCLDTTERVADLYMRLREAKDEKLSAELRKLANQMLDRTAGDLAPAFRTIRDNANALSKSDTKRAQAIVNIDRVIDLEAFEGGVRLQSFFEEVSRSVVSGQEQLNRESIRYVQHLDRRIPPSFFAIPSVRAEIKAGFVSSTGRGFNIVLFKKERQKKEYGESSVTFEVVAAPPPPGVAAFGGYYVPLPSSLVADREREMLLEEVRNQAKLGNPLPPHYQAGRPFAVVWQYQGTDDGSDHLVVWPGRRPDDPPASWQQAGGAYWRDLSVFYLKEVKGEQVLSGEIFSGGSTSPQTPFLKIRRVGAPPALIDLGDALINGAWIHNEWLAAVRIPEGPAEPSDS